MSYPDRLIDKRVVDRYIRKGMVDKAQYESLIEALPDMEHNAATALDDEAEAEAEQDQPEATGASPAMPGEETTTPTLE